MQESIPPVRRPPRKGLWLWITSAILVALVLQSVLIYFIWQRWQNRPGPLQPAAQTAAQVAGPISTAELTHPETRKWMDVPRGTQICDNVTFICNGAIRTAGFHANNQGKNLPGAILHVPVGGTGSRIHLLQAAEYSWSMPVQAPYCRMLLHYADGQTRELNLLFGVHGKDWFETKEAKVKEPVLDPNSKVAWTHQRSDGVVLRFYHTILENPLPQTPIVDVDFISPLERANLLLFGVTLNDEPPTLAPAFLPTHEFSESTITLVAQDENGSPRPDVTVTWTLPTKRQPVVFPPMVPNRSGEVELRLPVGLWKQIQYLVSTADGLTATGESVPGPDGQFPQKIFATLKQ
jgi:hypothetical protein